MQVRGLYRGLAAPLVGGALETGVSYTVRPCRCQSHPETHTVMHCLMHLLSAGLYLHLGTANGMCSWLM